MTKTFCFLLVGFLFGGVAAAQEYFVSGTGTLKNDGSQEKPFRHLQQAADIVQPGDTVWLMAGTYNSRYGINGFVLSLNRSGTADKPITWKAWRNDKPEIIVDCWTGIKVRASYQIIDGLKITGTNGTDCPESIQVKAREMLPTLNPDGETYTHHPDYTNTGFKPLDDARKDSLIDPNSVGVNGNPKYWGIPTLTSSGISISGKNMATELKPHHIVIRNCIISKCGGGGIGTTEADWVTIEDCQVFDTCWYGRSAGSGISFLGMLNLVPGDGYHVVVQRNKIWNNKIQVIWERNHTYSDGNGLIIDTNMAFKKGTSRALANEDVANSYHGRFLIANNLSVHNGGSGMHSFYSRGVDFYNNTTYHNGNWNDYPEISSVFSVDVNIRGNIMVPRALAIGGNVGSGIITTVAGWGSWDYNCYLPGFLAAKKRGPNDLEADPLFQRTGINPLTANFSLRPTSPAIDSSVFTHSAAMNDIEGTPRPKGAAFDRGAYEFLDTISPATPGAPTANSLTSPTPTISGQTEGGAVVRIYDGTTLLQTVSADGSGQWSWTVSPALASGSHPLSITASDATNNTSGNSPATTITVVDTTPPAIPAAPSTTSLVSATPTLSGTSEANATIRIYDSTVLLKTVVANGSGAWSWTVTPLLAEGTHAIAITASDTSGNTSAKSPATTMTVPDTTPPAVPAAPTASSLTSASPVLSGITEAGATIRIFAGASLLKSVIAGPSGVWSWTVTPALAVGSHALTVSATDVAGNGSSSSPATVVNVVGGGAVDTTAPATPGAPLVDNATSATPVLSGTTEAGATVSIFDGSSLLKILTASGTGSWSWTVTPALSVGSHLVKVQATDAAGNSSALSAGTGLSIADTTPPSTPAPPLSSSTTSPTPTLSGTTEPGASISIFDRGILLKVVVADALGAWSWTVTPALGEGEHQLSVTAADTLGNTSAASSSLVINVPDVTPPSKPTEPLVVNPNSATPTLSGVTEGLATVRILEQGTLIAQVVANGDGTWSWTANPALGQGTHQLSVTVSDASGNTSLDSSPVTISVPDTSPPATPSAPQVDATLPSQPVLSGIAELGSTITIFDGAGMLTTVETEADGTWTLLLASVAGPGAHSITITVTDQAGNVSGRSPVLPITITPAAPPPSAEVKRMSMPTLVGADTATPTLLGTADPDANVLVYDGTMFMGSVAADAQGRWSWTPSTAMTVGNHTLNLSAVDDQGVLLATADPLTITVKAATPTPPPVNSGGDSGSGGGCGAGGGVALLLSGLLLGGRGRRQGHRLIP